MNMKTIEKKKIKSSKSWLLKSTTLLLVKLAKFLSRLPDSVLVSLLSLAQGFIRLLRKGKVISPLDDIKEILQGDPEGNRAIRRILSESRAGQFRSLVEGMIKHQVRAKSANLLVIEESKIKPKKLAASTIKIGLVGEGRELDILRRKYEDLKDCSVIHIKSDDNKAIENIDGLEVGERSGLQEELILEALKRGIAVSAHSSAISSPAMLQKIYELSEKNKTPFRIFYPYLYYPPIQKIKTLLLEDLIGEVSTIRIRATIGGNGGNFEPEMPAREKYLTHPAFDHFLLLTYFGGPIEKVTAYLNPMGSYGGQGLVACKYVYPCRYGLLDCTFAPDLCIPSQFFPYDLEAEIAGIDGIIWLKRGMAKRVNTAPIHVRVGRKYFQIGVESGMTEDWSTAYKTAAEHFVDMIKGIERTLISKEAILSAFKAKDVVYESSESSHVIIL